MFRSTNLCLDASKEFWIRDWIAQIGADDIGSQSLRRLIGHLHSVLQHGHGEMG